MNAEKKRIFIVDDEPAITRLLKLNLEQTNEFVVRTENSARAALHAALEFHPDLILLDVIMPEMDGGYLASLMRDHSALRNVPRLFLTAAATKQEVRNTGGQIGGEDILAKPVCMSEVLERLRSRLGMVHEAGA